MKAITNDYKENIKLFGRQINCIVTYQENNEVIELGEDELNSITLNYDGNILKSVMKQLEIDCNVDIPVGTILNYQFGVLVDDEYEYINYGNFVVKNTEKQEDTNSYKILCYDKMLYSMKDYESMGITYPITIKNYINAICTHLGLTFKNINNTFANYNKQIQNELYLDNEGNSLGYTFRDVLDELAQVTGSVICIDDNDNLEIRYASNSNVTIDEDTLKDRNINFDKKYGPVNTIILSRSAGSDNISLSYPENLPDEDKIAVKIVDNQIMNWNDRGDYLSDILNKMLDIEYYVNDIKTIGITYLELMDKYNVVVGEKTYNCLMLNDEIRVNDGLAEDIYTTEPDEAETDYTKVDKTDRKINQTYLIVDKQNQQIQSVVSQVDGQNAKISQITQSVDEINSKISDIVDITTSAEDTDAQIELEQINESEPIQIKIHPTSENISLLYPNTTLYPSDTLYPKIRILRFVRTYIEEGITKTENIDYELPDDLLYYNQNNYDEFYLDYDSQTCQITKKCKYNADGSVGLLTTPRIDYYEYPYISLGAGNYVVKILGYNYGYIFARLMASNIYTTQFYTKAETNSKINQKADEIELGVTQTLSNYSTTSETNSMINVKANEINSVVSTKVGKNEVISSINQTSESIKINANKINLTGYVTITNLSTAGQTSINGNNIITGTIATARLSSDVITTSNFSAQNINASKITSGTLSTSRLSSDVITTSNFSAQNINASKITAGTLSVDRIAESSIGSGKLSISNLSSISANMGTITAGQISSSRAKLNLSSGYIQMFPSDGGSFIFNGAGRMSAVYGVGISSNSNGNVGAPSDNAIVIKGCNKASVYMGCMNTASGSGEVNGILVYSGGIYMSRQPSYGSDKRLKKDISDINDVSWIDELKIKEYSYKVSPEQKNIGLIAQDYENKEYAKYFLNKNKDGYYSIGYGNITNALIKYSQELKHRVEELEKRIK